MASALPDIRAHGLAQIVSLLVAVTLDNPIDRHFYERLLSYGHAKSAILADEFLIKRFWGTSEQIVTAIRAAYQIAPQAVARNSAVPDRQSLIGLTEQM
jgi:hypothetical protein